MRIKFTEFAADPKLRGTTSNFPAHIAQSLIAQGAAVAVPYKDFRERLAAEAAEGSDKSNPKVENVKVPQWGIHTDQFTGRQTLIRRQGFEEIRFEPPEEAVKAGCPLGIAGQVVSIEAQENLKNVAAEAAAKARQDLEARERLDRIRTGASLYTLGRKLVKPQ